MPLRRETKKLFQLKRLVHEWRNTIGTLQVHAAAEWTHSGATHFVLLHRRSLPSIQKRCGRSYSLMSRAVPQIRTYPCAASIFQKLRGSMRSNKQKQKSCWSSTP